MNSTGTQATPKRTRAENVRFMGHVTLVVCAIFTAWIVSALWNDTFIHRLIGNVLLGLTVASIVLLSVSAISLNGRGD